jgi:hypothetical protein
MYRFEKAYKHSFLAVVVKIKNLCDSITPSVIERIWGLNVEISRWIGLKDCGTV